MANVYTTTLETLSAMAATDAITEALAELAGYGLSTPSALALLYNEVTGRIDRAYAEIITTGELTTDIPADVQEVLYAS